MLSSMHTVKTTQSCSSNSRRTISRTSLNPPASLLTRLGLLVISSLALSTFPGLGGARFDGDPVSLGIEEGISSQSSLPIVSCLRKNGQSVIRSSKDSLASACDIGTGDDFMTAVATSTKGSVRRLRDEGVEVGVDPLAEEKNLSQNVHHQKRQSGKWTTYIQTLSATPPRRPNKHRRRISSWPIFMIWSLVSLLPGITALRWDLLGDADKDLCRIRSYNACLRDVVGVWRIDAGSRPRGVDVSDDRSSIDSLEVGVRRLRMRGVRSAREDVGVDGNKTVPFVGMIELKEAVIAESRLVGDFEDVREGEEGVGGTSSLGRDEEDFGDMEANTRVKDEDFSGEDRLGKFASGTIGTSGSAACIWGVCVSDVLFVHVADYLPWSKYATFHRKGHDVSL